MIEFTSKMLNDEIVNSLTNLLESFEDDIRDVVNTGEGVNFFSEELILELDYLIKNRNAIKQVLDLYVV